jgi:hypothetical protein
MNHQGQPGPHHHGGAGDQVEDAFEGERAPSLMPLGSFQAGDQGEDAIDQQIRGEEQHQYGQRHARQGESDNAKNHGRDAAQRQRPPILYKNVVHG